MTEKMTATSDLIGPEAFEKMLQRQGLLADAFRVSVEKLEPGIARLRLDGDERHLRSGGTICGPVMFTLADAALYALVLATAGNEIMAVTSDISIRFLRKPPPGDLLAEARLIKHGRRTIVGDVLLFSEDSDDPVAHVTGAYALPSGKAKR